MSDTYPPMLMSGTYLVDVRLMSALKADINRTSTKYEPNKSIPEYRFTYSTNVFVSKKNHPILRLGNGVLW